MVRYVKMSTKNKVKDIFGMSFNRKSTLNRLSRHANDIRDHIIRVVVYKDIRKQDLHHWIHDELSNWLYRATLSKCDVKLKPKDFMDTIFMGLGKTEYDAQVTLMDFQDDFCTDKIENPYPMFEITDELVSKVYSTYVKFIDTCMPVLLKGDTVSIDDWEKIIKPVFEVEYI